ncbi:MULTISPECIES: methyltransferase [unclassified Streptosporangium]|uniref:methyltransferase n=1 Tax=unclassified Streptosporangium TaxID=2632669 RepID=UPI002E2B2582|nr:MULTISPECIES: methyltransferase [unclassified Streptosporangium]
MTQNGLPQRARTIPRGAETVNSQHTITIQSIVDGVLLFGALNAFCELDLPDILDRAAHRTLPLKELASWCGAQPELLERLLLPLSAKSIVNLTKTVGEGSVVTLTPLGAALRKDVPGSLRHTVTMTARPAWWEVIPQYGQIARTGKPILPEGHRSLYEYLAANPDENEAFDAFMAARSHPAAMALTTEDFSGVQTVVDVGGGTGGTLATILEAHPHCRGVLQELPRVAVRAETNLAARGMADRLQVLPGDFFEGVPAMPHTPGKTVYLLSSVLHNWSDEDSLRILGQVRAAMVATGSPAELWLVEKLTLHALLDLRMMAFFEGGHERTPDQYTHLLARAGFVQQRTRPLAGVLTLVTATLASLVVPPS